MNNIYLFLIVLLWHFGTITQAQLFNYFEKTYDVSGWSDNGGAIITDDSSGYLLLSASGCFGNQLKCSGVIKTDLAGEAAWTSLLHNYPTSFGLSDVQKNSDSTYLFVGSAYVIAANSYKPFVMKMNTNGDSLWVKDFDDLNKDTSNKLEPTSDGNYIMDIVGGVYGQYSEIILQKITPEGEALWEQPLETGYQYHYPGSIQVLPNDEIAVAYTFKPYNNNNSQHKAALAKTDSLGNMVWNSFLGQTFWSSGDCGVVTKAYPNGDLIATWCRDTLVGGGISYYNPVIYKINNITGQVEWEYYFLKPMISRLRDITIAANGDIIGCGIVSLNYQEAWLFRLNPQGELLWEKYYSSALSPANLLQFNEVIEAPDGGITAIGLILEQDSIGAIPNGNVWLVHLDSAGCFMPDCVSDTIVITDVLEPESPEAHNAPSVFFSVAPNPSVGPMRVVFQQPLPWRQARLRVWDARGQAVQQQTLVQGALEAQADLTDFPPGLYLIALEAEGRVWQTEKVVRVEE